ncbi:hypothetical protein TURU_059048 [Turdus rufiventris]|nr:hypothetical protein TURU_059048 [Turdus rufiventris]
MQGAKASIFQTTDISHSVASVSCGTRQCCQGCPQGRDEISQDGWEIAAYLITFEKHEEWLTTSPKTRPQNGSMILYNRKKVKYRKDGYCWKKRKDGKTTREDHMKLKVQGVEVGLKLPGEARVTLLAISGMHKVSIIVLRGEKPFLYSLLVLKPSQTLTYM